MSKTYKLGVKKNVIDEINVFFKAILEENMVDILLVPQVSPTNKSVLQTLVGEGAEIQRANPFAPLLLKNSATMVGQITADGPKQKVGVVLRSCEVRAVVELVKLKQVNPDNLILIGVDCMGTYESRDYQEIAENSSDTDSLTMHYLAKAEQGRPNLSDGKQMRLACMTCENPSPDNVDIAINFLGCDVNKEIFIRLSDKFEEIEPEKLNLVPAPDISIWQKACASCVQFRTKAAEELFANVLEATKDITNFMKEIESCRRCYNCRKECPICYCRECIFDSITFEHSSQQYFEKAKKKGRIRMPSDTLLFHLTRMNHMVVSCVGCGQCTSACPNGIPIAKFFKTVGRKVQNLFDYKAGRDFEEPIPQSTFKEEEFPEVGEISREK